MNKTLIAATTMLMLGAPIAFAASNVNGGTPYVTPAKPTTMHVAAATPAEQCTALEQQFKKEEASHKTMKSYKDAAKMRDEGKTLCAENKATEGIKKLEDGLKLIGVTPAVKS